MNTRTVPVVVINVFTPKPEALDAFLALQVAALPALRAGTTGARGSRLISESPAFAAHRTKILPLLERAEPGRYQLVYEAGDL